MATRGLITITEAAVICGLTRQRLYQLFQAGRFLSSSMKIGNVNVWDENEVKEWSETYALAIEESKLDKRRLYGERTKEILRLTANGLKPSEIARKLGTSTQIVCGYLHRLKKNFQATDRKDLAQKAIDKGII